MIADSRELNVCECGDEGVGAYGKIRGSEGSVSFLREGRS